MNIRKEDYNNEKHYKVIVICDSKTCKQPHKEFRIWNTTPSVHNNFFLCPSCIQLQPKTRNKLVESATNQWKTIRDKMIKSINNGNLKPESKVNKSIATTAAWNDPLKRESMLNARKPGTKYFKSRQKTMKSKKFREKQSLNTANAILNGFCCHSNYIHGYFYSKKNETKMYYRSSLELNFFNLFEKSKFILKFKSEPFRILYKDHEEIWKNYIPDCLIEVSSKNKYLVELKPKGTAKLFNNLLKIKAAKLFCKENNLKFRVLTEKFCNFASLKKVLK